jgi:multidrug efflux pump subunit AcrA (membrane-fusion protein)
LVALACGVVVLGYSLLGPRPISVEVAAVTRVRVPTGHQADDAAEVLGGLRPGQSVILHPSNRIEDGTKVAPRS